MLQLLPFHRRLVVEAMVRKRFRDSSHRMATTEAQERPSAKCSANRGTNSSNSIPRLNHEKYVSSAMTPG